MKSFGHAPQSRMSDDVLQQYRNADSGVRVMLAFAKYIAVSTLVLAAVIALYATVPYLDEQDSLRTAVAARSI
jgi:hypothetical protein